MKASEIKNWPERLKSHEWPDGTLEHMDSRLFTDCAFPLRKLSGIPMSPSKDPEAHVRHDDSGSRHSTKDKTRLSDATDVQVSSCGSMIDLMNCAEQIPAIGGIGIYFDTHRPLVHIDRRPNRLVWLCYKEKGERVYTYRENDPIAWYKKLGELLEEAGL